MATERRLSAPQVYVWGDDLVKSKISFTKQMVDEFEKCGLPMIGVQEVSEEDVVRYGIVKLREGTMEIEGIIEKPSIEEAPSRLADFGRMILNQDFVDILKETALGKGNELWVVDAIQKYVKQGGKFLAKPVEGGEWLTTGDPLNYMKASLKYAMDRKDFKDDLRDFWEKNFK